MSSANQSTLAQAMGMGDSLESMNRVVCRTGTPWASSPALSKTMDTGSGPQARLFDSPVAGGLPGAAPRSGWAARLPRQQTSPFAHDRRPIPKARLIPAGPFPCLRATTPKIHQRITKPKPR